MPATNIPRMKDAQCGTSLSCQSPRPPDAYTACPSARFETENCHNLWREHDGLAQRRECASGGTFSLLEHSVRFSTISCGVPSATRSVPAVSLVTGPLGDRRNAGQLPRAALRRCRRRLMPGLRACRLEASRRSSNNMPADQTGVGRRLPRWDVHQVVPVRT